MAEFQDVIRQKKRMCNSVLCCKCDIYRLCGEDLSKCAQFINNNPKKAEEVIMSWAAKHPEPVYETWGQYFRRYYGLEYCEGHEMLLENIPDDIAQRLELQPKKG